MPRYGGGQHEGFHRRSRLTPRLRGEVELLPGEVEAADHGAYVAIGGVDGHHGGRRLEAEVQRRDGALYDPQRIILPP